MVKILMILFIIFKTIILSEIDSFKQLNFTIGPNLNNEVGKKGAVLFAINDYSTLLNLFSFNIKRETIFKINITDKNQKSYNVGCGLWIYTNSLIFCELDDKIPKGQYFFQFNETFNYSEYEIYLTSNSVFNIEKIDSEKIDIYSGPQTINIDDKIETYELKFNIISYNNEKIFLSFMNIEPLDCKRKNDELICQIKKTVLECYNSPLPKDAKLTLPLIYFNKKDKEENLYLIGYFIINFNIQKKDVFVNITKLLTNNIETGHFITYETNVTNIPSVIGTEFYLNFTGKEGDSLNLCFLKKGEYNPLLLLCTGKFEDNILSLKEIESAIRLNDINVKYNFIIQPVNNSETITIINTTYSLPLIRTIYPNILNFNEKDSFEINLYISRFESQITPLNGITFNEKEKDLECIDLEYKIKCNVTKEHFKGMNNKYYYIKYNNPYFNNKTTSFYTNPIKIILPKTDTKDNNHLIMIISIIASVIVFIIIAFVVIFCICKNKKSDLKEEVLKTSFKDTENEE